MLYSLGATALGSKPRLGLLLAQFPRRFRAVPWFRAGSSFLRLGRSRKGGTRRAEVRHHRQRDHRHELRAGPDEPLSGVSEQPVQAIRRETWFPPEGGPHFFVFL